MVKFSKWFIQKFLVKLVVAIFITQSFALFPFSLALLPLLSKPTDSPCLFAVSKTLSPTHYQNSEESMLLKFWPPGLEHRSQKHIVVILPIYYSVGSTIEPLLVFINLPLMKTPCPMNPLVQFCTHLPSDFGKDIWVRLLKIPSSI